MRMSFEQLAIFIACLALVPHLCESGGTLELTMIRYTNPGGKCRDGSDCDYFSYCDHVFYFGLDSAQGNAQDSRSNSIMTITTSYFSNQNTNNFLLNANDHGFYNPIRQTFSSWPGSVLFKVYVEDDDSPVTDPDPVDDLIQLLTVTPGADAVQILIYGRRSSSKTSLSMSYRVYCDTNYFGSACAVYCLAHDDNTNGHYTCDQTTGNIVCLAGWEDTTNMCRTFSDDCVGNQCRNGGTCIDGIRSYTCSCVRGYTGQYCDINIDDCSPSPCQNGGSCVDKLADYQCNCSSPWIGKTCSQTACVASNPCKNGGTCYGNSQCFCPDGYMGGDCSISFCDAIRCRNGGSCSKDRLSCVCLAGYTGIACEIPRCDMIAEYCQNGAVCVDGRCLCPDGFAGSACENNLICSDTTCLNFGKCRMDVRGNGTVFRCDCPSTYSGLHCEISLDRNASSPVSQPQIQDQSVQYTGGVDDKAVFIGLIVAVAVLGVVVIILIICICCMRRRRSKKQPDPDSTVVAYDEVGDSYATLAKPNTYDYNIRNSNRGSIGLYMEANPIKDSDAYDRVRTTGNVYSQPEKPEVESTKNAGQEEGEYCRVDDREVRSVLRSPPAVPAKRLVSQEEKIVSPC